MAKHEDLPIPIYSSLSCVYGEDEQQSQLRFNTLKSTFVQIFGHVPNIYSRSPVPKHGKPKPPMSIGDYENYSVLPMAIRQDTIVAIREDSEKVLRIANVNDKYSMFTYPADPNQDIDLKNHKWGHYLIYGYKGFYEYAKSKGVDVGEPVGLDVMIDGIVPRGSDCFLD